jgi:hypothetical protein
MIERLGTERICGRDVYVLELRAWEELRAALRQNPKRFICLLAWDARDVQAAAIGVVARQLLDAGAVAVACWGPNCERVHDIIDAAAGQWLALQAAGVVMTTWHAQESLSEAMDATLLTLSPDDASAPGCDAVIGISIGEPEWADEIREAARAAGPNPKPPGQRVECE